MSRAHLIKVVVIIAALTFAAGGGYLLGARNYDGEPGLQPANADNSELASILNAYQSCEPNYSKTLTFSTVEGDPIATKMTVIRNADRSKGCRVKITHDTTQDRFGGQQVTEAICEQMIINEFGQLLASACDGGVQEFLLPLDIL